MNVKEANSSPKLKSLSKKPRRSPVVDCSGVEIEPSAFKAKQRVDGHDNLYIFTLENDRHVIGRLNTRYDRKADEEIESMSILWGFDVFPIVHRVLFCHDAMEGQQTLYDVEIVGLRRVIPTEAFKNGMWIDYFPGLTGVLDSSKERMYKAVIMQVAKDAPKIAAFETTGYHKVSDGETEEWIYLLPDGRFLIRPGIDPSRFDVILTRELLSEQEKRLWATLDIHSSVPSRERQQAAYDYLKRLVRHGQALILLSNDFAALFYDIRNATFGPSHSLDLIALPGEGKTSLAGFCRCICAPYAFKAEGDASFQDTVTMIEMRLTYRSSMPTIVDDITEDIARDADNAEKLDRISRAVFNQVPVKRRATQRMTERRANYIRTLPVFTAEYIPRSINKSWYRRVLILELADGELLKDDGMREYAPVLQYWGLGLIQIFQQRLARYGYDRVVSRLEQMYRELRLRLREKIIAKWKREQPNNSLPGDWDSIGDSAAYVLLYFDIFRYSIGSEIETSIDDIMPHLVETVYHQILRMEGRLGDEEGLLLFEKGMLSLFEDVRLGKVENGQRWRVDHKVPASGPIEPPQVWYAEGKKFPFQFWGWTPEMVGADDSGDHGRVPQFCTIAYVDDSTLYLTDRARKELLKIISKQAGGEGITSEKALGELAEKEGWIAKRADGKRRAIQIVPPSGPTRVWGLSLTKFLAHYQDVPSEELADSNERPDNVSDFPAKTEPSRLTDQDEEIFEDF